MVVRVTTVYVRENLLEKYRKIYEESIIPAARQQKGYCGAFLMTDHSSGKSVSVTLWETEMDIHANEQNRYYQEQILKVLVLLAADPIRELFEVDCQDFKSLLSSL